MLRQVFCLLATLLLTRAALACAPVVTVYAPRPQVSVYVTTYYMVPPVAPPVMELICTPQGYFYRPAPNFVTLPLGQSPYVLTTGAYCVAPLRFPYPVIITR